jgi:hypothetical protein
MGNSQKSVAKVIHNENILTKINCNATYLHYNIFHFKNINLCLHKFTIDMSCHITQYNNYIYENIIIPTRLLTKEVLIVDPIYVFSKGSDHTLSFKNDEIIYTPPIEKYELYSRRNTIYKKNTNHHLTISIKITNELSDYITQIIKIFAENYYKSFVESENVKKYIKIKLFNNLKQRQILQLLQTNKIANITIYPSIKILNDMCYVTFHVSSVDDNIILPPIAEQIIIINDADVIAI